ncbi:hypothetical protein Anapl_03437 [Anas platyrhynchos]|uniref:Uncharacterized protein n=1 Tax=Anas platyrhynchos TaxID=8839 RepID=R0LL70_ANAPL|nr:hypothetical protein Anapl_03437 [Anas platyrhynchos]
MGHLEVTALSISLGLTGWHKPAVTAEKQRTCWRTTAEQRKNERPPNEDFSQLERAQLLHPNFDPREQATAHRLITAHPLPEASCRDGFYPSWDNKRRASIDANGRMGLSQLKAAPRSRRQGQKRLRGFWSSRATKASPPTCLLLPSATSPKAVRPSTRRSQGSSTGSEAKAHSSREQKEAAGFNSTALRGPDTTSSTDPKLLAGIHQQSRLLDDSDQQLLGTAISSCHKMVYKYCLRASALSLN